VRYDYIVEQSANCVEFIQVLGCLPSLADAKSISNMRLHISPNITVRVSRRPKGTYNWQTLFYACKNPDEHIVRQFIGTGKQEVRNLVGRIVRNYKKHQIL